jgi:tryptophan-rich sensory protein
MISNFTKVLIILLPLILGFGSGLFYSSKNIPKPKTRFNPPGWVFGVVWPILYLLLGYSSYLIYSSNSKEHNTVFILYIIHLLLLTAWWPFFVKYPGFRAYAFWSLIFILFYACLLFSLYYKINKRAAYCLIPYILWLSFASYLSYST